MQTSRTEIAQSGVFTAAATCGTTPFTSPAVVGAGVEFTGRASYGKCTTNFDIAVDIGESDFSVTFTPTGGFVTSATPVLTLSLSGLDFTPAATITGVTWTNCPGSPCTDPWPPIVTFTDHTIDVSWTALGGNVTYTFDILTNDPTVVPEPSSIVLLGTGFASVIARRYRRKGVGSTIVTVVP